MNCRFCQREIDETVCQIPDEFLVQGEPIFAHLGCLKEHKLWCDEHDMLKGPQSPCPICLNGAVAMEEDNIQRYVRQLDAALPQAEFDDLMELDEPNGIPDPSAHRLVLLRNIVYTAMVVNCTPQEVVNRACKSRSIQAILPPLMQQGSELALTAA